MVTTHSSRTAALLDQVRRQLAHAENQVVMLKRIEAFLTGDLAEPPPAILAEPLPDLTRPGRPPHVVLCSIAWLPQAAAAGVILQDRGPLPTGKIVECLIESGYPAKGKTYGEKLSRLANSLYSVLAKMPKRFRKVEPGVWDVVREEPSQPRLNERHKAWQREVSHTESDEPTSDRKRG